MAQHRARQLSSLGFRKPTVSKKSLLCVLLAGFALSACPLIAFYTDGNNPDLCFINWRNVLFTAYCFVKLVVALFRSSVRQTVVRYGLLRVILCSLFIIVFSYMTVAVALDRAALMTWDALESSFIHKFEENIVTINETRKEFTVREIRTFEPVKLEQQMRYKGEDVRLVCEDTLVFKGKVKFHEKQVIWKHNMKRIESSSRYHIKTVFEEIPKNDTMKLVDEILEMKFYVYKVKSELDIYLIEKADFGKFSCHVAKLAIALESRNTSRSGSRSTTTSHGRKDQTGRIKPKQPPSQGDDTESHEECPVKEEKATSCPCSLEELRLLLPRQKPLFYKWKAEIFLKEIHPNRRIISVPVGSIVSASASYSYLDDRPITFDHEINGKSFVDICSGLNQSCSILIYLYWFLWHDGGHFANIPNFFQRMQMVEGIGGTSWQCVCPYTYGLHKFVFYREFYNSTLRKYQTVGIDYPDSIEIVPERPNILDPYFNGTKETFQLPQTSCWGGFKTTVCKYLEEILQTMACNFFYREKVYFIAGIVTCLVFAVLVSKFSLVWITNPCINLILGRNEVLFVRAVESSGTLAGLANLKNTVLKYDLYISCAPEQSNLASDIAEYLKSHGLRVCHSDADILGNEMTTQGLSRLITESWKFLVIVTPEYVISGLQNNFEMQLILQRLHDGYASDSNIALMSSEAYLIPDIFARFTVFKWLGDNIAVVEYIRNWIGPSIFPSTASISPRIEPSPQYHFTSASILYILSCFCFYILYMMVSEGTVI